MNFIFCNYLKAAEMNSVFLLRYWKLFNHLVVRFYPSTEYVTGPECSVCLSTPSHKILESVFHLLMTRIRS